ncbi:hypothetical protein T492DRAFT_995019 [Pavlovales sp. CCMP2436]|nr:hypothetical protein T492DRAFT_995019 [Pavlovales sp. CCMP2436]
MRRARRAQRAASTRARRPIDRSSRTARHGSSAGGQRHVAGPARGVAVPPRSRRWPCCREPSQWHRRQRRA